MPNGTFSTLYLHLRIHIKFLNDERGKEKTGDAVACTT